MEKVLEFQKNGDNFTVITEGFSKKEIHVDGAYEVFLANGTAKIRFYSATGVENENNYVVENNASIVMTEKVLIELSNLLSEACDDGNTFEKTKLKITDPTDGQNIKEPKYTEIGKFL